MPGALADTLSLLAGGAGVSREKLGLSFWTFSGVMGSIPIVCSYTPSHPCMNNN